MSDELFWGVSFPFLEHIISSAAAALIKFTTYQKSTTIVENIISTFKK